jgi:hypothetical protein
MSSETFNLNNVLFNRKYFDYAVVWFFEMNSRWRRLDSYDVILFEDLLKHAVDTDACLDVKPFFCEVWAMNDFYCKYVSMFFFICLEFHFNFFSNYPGYAKYREIYCKDYARLLWWLESGEDVYHPHPWRSDFRQEILLSTVRSHLEKILVEMQFSKSNRKEVSFEF